MGMDLELKTSFIKDTEIYILTIKDWQFAYMQTSLEWIENLERITETWYMPSRKFESEMLEKIKSDLLGEFCNLINILRNTKYFQPSKHNLGWVQPIKDDSRINFKEMDKSINECKNRILSKFNDFCMAQINMSMEIEVRVVNLINEAILRRMNNPFRLKSMEETDFSDDIRDIIEPILQAQYGICVEREKPSGYARKTIGETDINMNYYDNNNIYKNLCIGEVKKWGKYKKQLAQLFGYLKEETQFGFVITLNQTVDINTVLQKRLEIINDLDFNTQSIEQIPFSTCLVSIHKIQNKFVKIYHFIANAYNPEAEDFARMARS